MSEGRNTASGHLRAASRIGIPECTPNSRASREAVATTVRALVGSPEPPTTTGLPRSSGRRSTSTDAKNWSRSTCSTQVSPTRPVCRPVSVAEAGAATVTIIRGCFLMIVGTLGIVCWTSGSWVSIRGSGCWMLGRSGCRVWKMDWRLGGSSWTSVSDCWRSARLRLSGGSGTPRA